MASYREWILPLNPPNPYGLYLFSLAPVLPGETKIYYTKYILGIIGELDLSLSEGNVREWTCPPQLYTSTYTSGLLEHAERGPDPSAIWCNLRYPGALVQFRPASGLFIRYSPRGRGPVFSPDDLKFDGTGKLWFCGSTGSYNTIKAGISCFNPATKEVTTWEIPNDVMLNIVSIFPNRAGRKVWVSSIDANAGSTRHWIGCLDVGTGTLACFSPSPYVSPPRSRNIVLRENGSKELVWFTAAKNGAANAVVPGIYALAPGEGIFYKYEIDTGSWPRYIALDAEGLAYVTDIANNSIIRCDPAKSCRTIPFRSCEFHLSQSSRQLHATKYSVHPVVSTAPSRADTVQVTRFPCTTAYGGMSMGMPDHIRCQLPTRQMEVEESRNSSLYFAHIKKIRKPSLYFVNWGYNKVGVLRT